MFRNDSVETYIDPDTDAGIRYPSRLSCPAWFDVDLLKINPESSQDYRSYDYTDNPKAILNYGAVGSTEVMSYN